MLCICQRDTQSCKKTFLVRIFEDLEMGRYLRASAACCGMRGRKVVMDRDTSCSWLHMVNALNCALVQAPPIDLSS